MTKRKVGIKHRHSRVLLSEVLPYEVPIGFSNYGLYKFLNSTKMRFIDDMIHFNKVDESTRLILTVIFGKETKLQDTAINGQIGFAIKRSDCEKPTVPFSFHIRHRDDFSRKLSIAHPKSQLAIVGLYEKYKGSILYHTSRSPFSVRRPHRVTRYTVVRDGIFAEKKDSFPGTVETESSEYDRLRSFFVYQKYDNVHKFYESDEYRANEKKFGHLLRLDVSKCFDSIYTHSISWAVFDKESVKRKMSDYETTFSGNFDRIIRAQNDNETHGILIGPEVSRIFAEVVLQRIDREIESYLAKRGLVHQTDYTILRYVDDYFIFLRDPARQDEIVKTIDSQLRPYRFHLNREKEEVNTTPFISSMSIAKDRISAGIEKHLKLLVDVESAGAGGPVMEFQSSSRQMIGHYKTVLSETNLKPIDVVNFTLADIERQLERVLVKYETVIDGLGDSAVVVKVALQRVLMRLLAAALELSFFIYGGSPRVAPAIKLARIVSLVRKFTARKGFSRDHRDALDDLVFNEVLIQLGRNPLHEFASVECLYLLALLADLGEHYVLDLATLCAFTGIESSHSGSFSVPEWFNVLVACELLRYMKNALVYRQLQSALESWIVAKVTLMDKSERSYAEQPLLVLNVVSSPYVSDRTKRALLNLYGKSAKEAKLQVMDRDSTWFLGWKDLDLHSELLLKRVQEVY